MSAFPANRLHLGVAFHPEHWPETRWPDDIRLMTEARISVVRMGELAWPKLEPAQDEFDLDWWERAIEMLAQAGIVTVLSTPVARPPAWLRRGQPSILAVDEHGDRVQDDDRPRCCVNSPIFHQRLILVVAAMAERFGSNPGVIGWEIGNAHDGTCFCEHCRTQFQRFLQERYENLDALNECWATHFVGYSYSDWTQISLPNSSRHPGLWLDFQRFQTASHHHFQRLQIDALRPHLRPEVWITRNFSGWAGGMDGYALAADVDVASWDWSGDPGQSDYPASAAAHDLARGYKQQDFWVLESRPDSANPTSVHNARHKGEERATAWHAVAHGAKAIVYGQWRSSPYESPHRASLLDQSGRPRLFWEEVRQLGHDFAAASPLLAGSKSQAGAAIIHDYDSRWSFAGQTHLNFDYAQHLRHYHRPLAAANVAVDIISPDITLNPYRLVIVPALAIADDEFCQRLKSFVKRGGYLILTGRSGMKDRHNLPMPQRQPGPLTELAGIEVAETFALSKPIPVRGGAVTGQARLWAERLHLFDDKLTQVMARFGVSNGWLDHQAAITVHPFGKGMVYYVGAYLDDAAQTAFMALPMRMCSLKSPLKVPAGVEVSERVAADGRTFWIIINHTRGEQRVQTPRFVHDHLAGTSGAGNLKLDAYGVLILTEQDRVSAPAPLSLPRAGSVPP